MKGKSCNRTVLATLASTLLVLFAGWSLARSVPDTVIFGPDRGGSPPDLDRLPAVDLREIKLSHATRVPRYDIGLFGNSRVVSVSATDLRLAGERYFNFAVPGTSIRNSISMLARLGESGRLPRTVIIGMDNLYLEYFENPEAGLFPERLSLMAQDIRRILTGELPLYDGCKLLWRHLYKAWSTFETWLKFGAFSQQISLFNSPSASPYRNDGSRQQVIEPRKTFPMDLALRAPSILPAVLRHDLAQLRSIAATNGIRVMVVETPLHPFSVTTGNRAGSLRAVFRNQCGALKLECHSIAGSDIARGAGGWPDATHAPAGALGRTIAKILQSELRAE